MYVKRIRLVNYGPIHDLDIRLPFEGETPKPVLLVGKNGAGKSILLSHIVNGMFLAKEAAYSESRETEPEKVFKLRSNSYITSGKEFYCARIDFESHQFIREVHLRQHKSAYPNPPMGIDGPCFEVWETESLRKTDPVGHMAYDSGFGPSGRDHFSYSFNSLREEDARLVSAIVRKSCLLYFPSNRMEEPAWLNKDNLTFKPTYTKGPRVHGATQRQILAHSPLQYVINWLFDLVYDRAVFELKSESTPGAARTHESSDKHVPESLFLRYNGDASEAYNVACQVLQAILPSTKDVRFGIGRRQNRNLTVESSSGSVVPNVFQLSSGELVLLSLFLSVLRDFDLRENRSEPFSSSKDVKGLVIVDEIDLHLHTSHQFEVLPQLIKMFPNVQFILTTHSPLFVLGMEQTFGRDGFVVHELPTGSRIDPEEFEEIGNAFRAFKATREFEAEIEEIVKNAQKPLLFVEGTTDCKYLLRAAQLLGYHAVLEAFEVKSAGGDGEMGKVWRALSTMDKMGKPWPAILLHDPEYKGSMQNKGKIHRIKMPLVEQHPIRKGIENLFEQRTLGKAITCDEAFIDIRYKKKGTEKYIPVTWNVSEGQKTNLCSWLCENGTREDFLHFNGVLEELAKIRDQHLTGDAHRDQVEESSDIDED